MERKCAAAGISVEFFKAFDGSKGEHVALSRYDDAMAFWLTGHRLTPGELGCFASHYTLWLSCVELRQPLLILEDDIDFSPRISEAIAVLEALVPRYQMIRLAGTRAREHRVLEKVGAWEIVRFNKGPYGTTAYAISPAAAAMLLAKANTWWLTVDRYVDRFWSHGVQSVGILPYPVMHGSPADTEIEPHRFHAKHSFAVGLRREGWRLVEDGRRLAANWAYKLGRQSALQ